MTPEQMAAYALDYGLQREGLKPAVQIEYDRQLEARRSGRKPTLPVAFPALGVQVRGDVVEAHATVPVRELGPLPGAEARLTDGTDAWDAAKALLLAPAIAGLASKKKAVAFIVFANGTHAEKSLNGNRMVREAQAECIRFNLLAGKQAPPPLRVDPADALRTLASLHNEGLLTDEEYAAKRAEVIARI